MDRITEWIDAFANLDFLAILVNPINVIINAIYDLIQDLVSYIA